MLRKTLFSAAIIALGTAANATVVQYNDVASFNAALPGGTSTLETFDTVTPGLFTAGVATNFDGFSLSYVNRPSSTQQVGIVTAAQVNGANGTSINDTNSLGWGEDLILNGNGDGPTITFEFFSAITAFAFDFSDSDRTDSYSVQIGTAAPFALAVPSNSSTFISFFGFVSDTPFTRIVFDQTRTGGFTETFSVDNIRTNGISAPPPPPTNPVPLPAAGWMLIAGLGGLAALRRRQARAAA